MNSFGQPSFFDYFAEINRQFHFTGETYNTRQMTANEENEKNDKDLETKMNLSYGQNTNLLACKNVKY